MPMDMRTGARIGNRTAVALLIAVAGAGVAQAADYVTIRRTADVAGTPDAVWARIGDYCTIAKMLDMTCRYAEGSGDVGTVRNLNDGAVMEPMVGGTAHSYTYGQIVGGMKDFDYHGTLAAEPAGRGRTRIVYTIVYDAARMASDEARAAQHVRLEGRFQGAVDRAKLIAEGKLIPAPSPVIAPARP